MGASDQILACGPGGAIRVRAYSAAFPFEEYLLRAATHCPIKSGGIRAHSKRFATFAKAVGYGRSSRRDLESRPLSEEGEGDGALCRRSGCGAGRTSAD